jgi:hypothetical protein
MYMLLAFPNTNHTMRRTETAYNGAGLTLVYRLMGR